MAITIDVMKKWINTMSFIPVDGETDVYHKIYTQHAGYTLRVNCATKVIEYIDNSFSKSGQITIGSKSTSNFSQMENLVVLECVNRLLEKGYSPHCIELEKVYPSGRGRSGELDILVKSEDGQAFLMIECKTWGKEFNNEEKKMLSDGGQLFAYYTNARSTKFLCLYTSRLQKGELEYSNKIVDIAEDWIALSEVKDIHEQWNKILKKNGVFEPYASPYNIVHKRLTYGELENMKDEDSRKIFHHIMTILRYNGVSDKPNAFNKLLNLFVCKIIDEDKNPNDELQFQTWEGLSDEKLQMTLNDLYREGMWRFLEIKVIDHSEDEVNGVLDMLGGDAAQKKKLITMFMETRLKKSPNFAFVEVQDQKTFELNAKIVREIVELLQHYKFRYDQKHEFLGDFFEKMLNTSMKQESGQFFTPVPITRFIISCMPLYDLVQTNINENSADPLPTIIDYACGSGHFLTEFMSAMQTIIEKVDISKAQRSVRGKLESWRGSIKFNWADQYVYGIDFDGRLVKTAKVSAFFNGDGEAQIIWGDGLDSFEHSEVYKGKLNETQYNKRDNGQFDILISNPPYSVEAFKRMLKHGQESFELFSGLTDNSSEIECLFVERMKQLLKIGGWAGVILPSSMLSNGGIYARTRDILFKYFRVKAIVEFGSGTFMETGTNTITMFLERRPDSDHVQIGNAIITFFTNKQDVTVMGIERAFSAFVANVYDDLTFEDYLSFISENPSDKLKEHELYRDYVREYGNDFSNAFEVEKTKMLYFLLTHNQNIIVVKSGQKQDEKKFLGYEFSKRRGSEGIKFLPSGTMLFDENDPTNPAKVSSYILNAFSDGSPMGIDEVVANHLSYGRMSDFFEYGTSKFGKRVNLGKPIKRITKWPAYKLGELLREGIFKQESGYTFPKNSQGNTNRNDIPFYKVSDMNEADYNGLMAHSVNYVSFDALTSDIKGRTFPKKAIIFPKVGQAIYTNKKRMLSREAVCDNNIMAIWIVDKQKWSDEFLFVYFNLFVKLSDYASSANPPSINIDRLSEIHIPCPPLNIQQQIIAEYGTVEKEIETVRESIVAAEQGIKDKFIEMFGDPVTNPMGWELNALGNFGSLKNGMNYNRQDIGYRIKSLGVGDFGNRRVIDTPSELSEISLSVEPAQDYLLSDGDIVFVRSNGNKELIGRSVEIITHGEKITFSGFCIRFRLESPLLLPTYINHAFHIPTLRKVLIRGGSGANIKNLNQQLLSSVLIPIPPINKQNEFVRFVDDTAEKTIDLQKQLDALLLKHNEIFTKYL